MQTNEFLAELQDVLQRDDPVLENDVLDDYEEWDSLAKMAVMAFFDRSFAMKITFPEMKNIHTVKDLIKLANGNVA